jgi:uncharacterized damage-inducible protein DinB
MPVATPAELTAYETIPARIRALVERLSDAELRYRPAPDAWSIHEILVHLADSEGVGFERLRRLIAEEEPLLLAYDEGTWAARLHYLEQDCGLALTLFDCLRHSNAALLRQQEAAAWERRGQHSERGTLTLYDCFKMLLDHGTAHLAQIEEVLRALPAGSA